MNSPEDLLLELRKQYEQKYGFAVFDLQFKETKDKISVRGAVLTPGQKRELVSRMQESGYENVEDKICVLSDSKSRELGWAVVKTEVADLKSRFVDNALLSEKILKRVRASQACRGEILRVLFQKADQLLVQSEDLTLGWIDRRDVICKKGSLRKIWRRGKDAEPDKQINSKVSGEKIVQAAEKFMGIKYILGARSEKSIDCSGLTQLAYKNAAGIILPRHSWDQKEVGVTVNLEEAQPGDLVFMKNIATDTKHVGILEIAGIDKKIVHASFTDGKVVRQDAATVFAKYKLVEIKRIIKK